jgi:thiol:disulfide interchange protein DsbA
MRASLRIALFAVIAVTGPWARADEALREGTDYTVIQAVAGAKSPKIVVTEFFSYQCPHCFAFAKPLHEWSLRVPADVQFERAAVSIGHKPWVDIARTYYTLQAMGNLESLDAAIFNAIHQQGVRMDDIAYIMGWLSQHKVAVTEFDTAYRSAKVRESLALGEQLAVEYKVLAIPTLVIDGKYMVTIASNLPFEPQLAKVDKVIALARSNRSP